MKFISSLKKNKVISFAWYLFSPNVTISQDIWLTAMCLCSPSLCVSRLTKAVALWKHRGSWIYTSLFSYIKTSQVKLLECWLRAPLLKSLMGTHPLSRLARLVCGWAGVWATVQWIGKVLRSQYILCSALWHPQFCSDVSTCHRQVSFRLVCPSFISVPD